jgi:hypothetical protein
MNTLTAALAFFEEFLGQAHAVSILLGLVIAMAVTQWAKYPLRRLAGNRGWSLATFKFTTRSFAAGVGFVATWASWPAAGKFAVLWGLATGFSAPAVYMGLTRALGHFWPWLADKASTDTDDTDQAGV